MTRSNHMPLACWALLGAWVVVVPGALGAPEMEDLGDRLLGGGLESLLSPQQESPSGEGDAPRRWGPTQQEVDEMARQGLGGAAPPAGEDLGQPRENPLVKIQTKMHRAEGLIADAAGTGDAARVQDEVVADLDALIQQMEKQCQGGGACNKPPQPQGSQRSQPKQAGAKQPSGGSRSRSAAERSTARLQRGKVEGVTRRSPEALMKDVWGHLPEHLREQMLQGSSAEFLPEYREELERYYQRLAEEPVGSEGR